MKHYDPRAVIRDNVWRDAANKKKFEFVMKNMKSIRKKVVLH